MALGQQPNDYLICVQQIDQDQAGITVEDNKGTPGENHDLVIRDVDIL